MRSPAFRSTTLALWPVTLVLVAACGDGGSGGGSVSEGGTLSGLSEYTTVTLSTDTTVLTVKERQMIPLLIDAARMMDSIYWKQAWGSRDSLYAMTSDPDIRRFIDINYGPYDRLADNQPFISEIGARRPGANLYPADMAKEEFEKAVSESSPARADSLRSLYTIIRRGKDGSLEPVPYHVAFAGENAVAAGKLREAAELAEDPGLRRYLRLRADALLSDNYRASDLAWLDMKNNTVELVIGPIETYEDELFGYKAANEAYVLIKDKEWSKRLSRYAALLPTLQRGIPVAPEYKSETPGTDSDLNAYDAIYYAGQANAGSKTIAINLPNDEQVQLEKGTRRLQLKNVMRAKFDRILVPIAEELLSQDQVALLTFDSFFSNVMFHEVAHGLGIKNTINGRGSVRAALMERAGSLEEGKADILGLYMVQKLNEQGEIAGEDIRSNYVSFLASIFRSVRFGTGSAHGRANIAAFNFLKEAGAFTRDAATGKYSVDFAKFGAAMNALTERILTLQGNGDYEGVGAFQDKYGSISTELQNDLDRLRSKGIPVDIVFDQGS